MRKQSNFFCLPFAGLAMVLLLVAGVRTSLAWEIPPKIPGEYPGKWYGWYCTEIPQEKIKGFYRGTAFPNQTILDSWGYKAKPMEEIKDLLPATSVSAFVQLSSAADLITANVRFRWNFREGQDLWIVYSEVSNSDRYRGIPVLARTDSRALIVKYTHTFAL